MSDITPPTGHVPKGSDGILSKKGPGGIPMPVLIGGVVGIGYLLYRKLNASQISTAATAADTTSTGTAGTTTDPYSSVGTGGWTSTPDPLVATTTSTTSTTSILDNDSWGALAETWLLGQNYDPSLVDGAVRAYLADDQLTVNQQAVINAALKQFGALPQPLPPAGTTPTRTPVTPTPPSTPTPAASTKYNPVKANGGTYQLLANPASVAAAIKAKQVIYMQLTPGFFVPEPTQGTTGIAGNTAEYIKVS